ncbi:hypothetical protein B4099_2557 [Heyndrickxia coagulans]|uniref:Uncharacterized protein n=1 Tax=Heyndrickxia coagulans TaxID=1398 RepID=A0A150JPC3_HEYCO|nr:hypothetical protein B4099_2557 [Heyndrickxia coagulans]
MREIHVPFLTKSLQTAGKHAKLYTCADFGRQILAEMDLFFQEINLQ